MTIFPPAFDPDGPRRPILDNPLLLGAIVLVMTVILAWLESVTR